MKIIQRISKNDKFNGLWLVNLELTSRCNKSCWICGRRKIERDFPEIFKSYGDMDFNLIESIARQLPKDIVVQFHNNGEPLLYPRFGEAISLFDKQVRCMDTNGILIIEKANEIIGKLDTITISIFEGDELGEEQFSLLKRFLEIRGRRKPKVVVKILGNVNSRKYKSLDCILTERDMKIPKQNRAYRGRPVIPEIGICLDVLGHLVIKSNGHVSVCPRFDPFGQATIGNCNDSNLSDIWNGVCRQQLLRFHIDGKRKELPHCRKCEFWGIPTGR